MAYVGTSVKRADDPRLLTGAAGWLVARTTDELRTGDHTFFVGEVVSLEEGSAADSLVYVHRGYHAL
jgi:flavin reductase (DIM6/NTAB) family NADH-FMN oxidoreductase RutF